MLKEWREMPVDLYILVKHFIIALICCVLTTQYIQWAVSCETNLENDCDGVENDTTDWEYGKMHFLCIISKKRSRFIKMLLYNAKAVLRKNCLASVCISIIHCNTGKIAVLTDQCLIRWILAHHPSWKQRDNVPDGFRGKLFVRDTRFHSKPLLCTTSSNNTSICNLLQRQIFDQSLKFCCNCWHKKA